MQLNPFIAFYAAINTFVGIACFACADIVDKGDDSTTGSSSTGADLTTEAEPANFGEYCEGYDTCKSSLYCDFRAATDCPRPGPPYAEYGFCTTPCAADTDCAKIDGNQAVCLMEMWDSTPGLADRVCMWPCSVDADCPSTFAAVLVCSGGFCHPGCGAP
jgi:hypothetical protein